MRNTLVLFLLPLTNAFGPYHRHHPTRNCPQRLHVLMSTTSTCTSPQPRNYNLSDRYFERLRLNSIDLDKEPTIGKLRIIQEAHLKHIPFENLSQHGCQHPASVDIAETANKILDCRRGGFCVELNGLLAEFLLELGYDVRRVPARVHVGGDHDNNGYFLPDATHIFLLVKIPNDNDNNAVWFVDVGFGEPAIRPLRYDVDGSNKSQQTTPDGMHSRFVANDDNNTVVLEWGMDSTWVPRLKWKVKDASFHDAPPRFASLAVFDYILPICRDDESVFAQKLIVCKLTRERKWSLAGNKLRITGPPRFAATKGGGMIVPSIIIRELSSIQEVQQVLLEIFGMPLETTQGLDLSKSLTAPTNMWSQL